MTLIDKASAELKNAALIIIDMQNDFVLEAGTSTIAGSLAVVPNISRLLTAWRLWRQPIVHVVRLYERDGRNAEIGRRSRIKRGPPIVAPYSDGSLPVHALLPDGASQFDPAALMAGEMQELSHGEWAMYKPRWGAFFQTPLETHLRSLDVSTLVICGCNFPNCPRATAFEASERDFQVVVVADATSQATDPRLADLSLIDVEVTSTDELLRLCE